MPVQFENQVQYGYAPVKKKSRFTTAQLIMMIAACVAVSALVLLKMPKTSTAPSPVPSGYIPPNVVDGRI